MDCRYCQHKLPDNKYRCKACGKWNDREERQNAASSGTSDADVIRLSKVKPGVLTRIQSGPWDYVFGGGIAQTSVCLLGGKRGAGKSTLFLQMARAIWPIIKPRPVIYIATEESKEQIKDRADRLGLTEEDQDQIAMVSAMGGLPNINEILERENPGFIFLDSLQGLAGESEDVALALARLMKEFATKLKCPVIMSAHVNKSDDIAGLEAVQHVVDSVMTFFPDEAGIRELMVEKNRDGKAFIATTFKMTEKGLEVLELMVDVEEEYEEDEDEDED